MLTEKAIKDYAWCPTMFRDLPGNEKRQKRDRSWEDDTIEQIHAAVTTGTPNKRVIPRKNGLATIAEAFEKDIWIVIKSRDVQLLLALKDITLTKIPGGAWQLIIRRKQPKKPRNEEALHVERMVRWLLANAFRSYFPRNIEMVVHTKYDNDTEPVADGEPTKIQLEEADDFIEEVRRAMEGEIPLASNQANCQYCWFAECPLRSAPRKEYDPNRPAYTPNATPNTGKTRIELL